MNAIYFLCFLVVLIPGPFALPALLPLGTSIIALVGFSLAGTLHFTTPGLLHLYTVLSHILHSPWGGGVVTALVNTAQTNLTGSPAARIRKRFSLILVLEPMPSRAGLWLYGG